MNRNKFTNIKISIRLYELLKTYPVFHGDGYKAISGAYHLLSRIHALSHFVTHEWAGISSKRLTGIFRGYNVPYNEAVTAMETCGLLLPRINGFYDRTGNGNSKVARFKLTELAKSILLEGEMEYLRKLADDKSCWKAAAERKKKAKQRYKKVGDCVCDYVAQTLFKIKIDEIRLNKLVEQFDANASTEKAQLLNILTYADQVRTGSFESLSRADVDGRLYHPLVQIKSEARRIFGIGTKNYRGTLDLRACHPTFFAVYLVKIFAEILKKNSALQQIFKEDPFLIQLQSVSNFNFDQISPVPSNLGDEFYSVHSSSTEYLHYLHAFVPCLLQECNKWNALWTDSNNDPRDILAEDAGYSYKSIAKKCMNSAINGGENRATKWIAKNFPCLYKIWRSTNAVTLRRESWAVRLTRVD
jgi:hypothetical protein